MPDIVSGASDAALYGGVSGAIIGTLVDDIAVVNPYTIGGVVVGSLIFLLRSHEEHVGRRLVYFLMSLIVGYSTAVWLVPRAPGVPPVIIGVASGGLIVLVTIAVVDWVGSSIAGLLTHAAQSLIGRIIGKGERNE